ncbi:MAG: class I SAM-dependent methyltransferase [Sedimentisphaerales bacterium]|nr:class I SAM-dependent methyltransferase [Sedimentisphaerales bacterium]
MNLIHAIKVKLYNAIRLYRWKVIRRLLDPQGKTLLDIGCSELFFYQRLKDRYEITLADCDPQHERIQRQDVQHLEYADRSFDIVLCQQVLEHVADPVRALGELQRVTRRQLIISVPYEPFFSLARFCHWEKNHLWAVTPRALEHHLGPPASERKIFFKRYYVGLWTFPASSRSDGGRLTTGR